MVVIIKAKGDIFYFIELLPVRPQALMIWAPQKHFQ